LLAEEPRPEPDRADEPEPPLLLRDAELPELFFAELDLELPFADDVRFVDAALRPPFEDELFAEDVLFARPLELFEPPFELLEPVAEDVFFAEELLALLPDEAFERDELLLDEPELACLPFEFEDLEPLEPEDFALEPEPDELFAPRDAFLAAPLWADEDFPADARCPPPDDFLPPAWPPF